MRLYACSNRTREGVYGRIHYAGLDLYLGNGWKTTSIQGEEVSLRICLWFSKLAKDTMKKRRRDEHGNIINWLLLKNISQLADVDGFHQQHSYYLLTGVRFPLTKPSIVIWLSCAIKWWFQWKSTIGIAQYIHQQEL